MYEIILLFIGFLVSFTAILKDKSKEGESFLKKYLWNNILSSLYILGFVFGLLHLFSEKKISNLSELREEVIFEGVEVIDSLTKLQVNQISELLKRNAHAINSLDSINNQIVNMVNQRDNLVAQYEILNEKLLSQNQITLQKLSAERARIIVHSHEISIDTIANDTSNVRLSFRMKNSGKHVARLLEVKGKLLFYNSGIGDVEDFDISNPTLNELIIYPHSDGRQYFEVFTQKISKTKFHENYIHGILIIKLNYTDELLNMDYSEKHIFSWRGFKNDNYKFMHYSGFKKNIYNNFLRANNADEELFIK